MDMVLSFVAAFLDRGTAYVHSAPTTKVYTMYEKFVNMLKKDWNGEDASLDVLVVRKAYLKRLKVIRKRTFHEHCETGWYTVKFHLLDHSMEDLEKFGSIDVVKGSPFEWFNVTTKNA